MKINTKTALSSYFNNYIFVSISSRPNVRKNSAVYGLSTNEERESILSKESLEDESSKM